VSYKYLTYELGCAVLLGEQKRSNTRVSKDWNNDLELELAVFRQIDIK